ncbi:MAG: tetratricopeptide repeat protein [Gemmatimonadetes bacterium]|nr:tetratricopeptide repeat protein [Gemmatimonadota bacterium]
MSTARSAVLTAVALLAAAPRLPGQAQHAHGAPQEYRLGSVQFPVSCSAEAQPRFERGVAMLHSFWFPEARQSFQSAADADANCAMAYWGIALTYLGNPFAGVMAGTNLAAGLEAAKKAQALGAPTARERGYVEAVRALYDDHERRDARTRRLAYEEAMKRVYEAHPEDPEATIFYALAVVANAPADDLTYRRQLEAVTILEPLFLERPDHPGLAHYIIHSYDAPSLARHGLDAARRYARIAPSVPHALHMPSHIFTRLGYWDESIETNRRSAEAERNPTGRFHPWDYMVYAFLQQGRDAAARKVVDEALHIAAQAGAPEEVYNAYNLVAMPVRYALERGRWDEAAKLVVHPAPGSPWTEALTRFARGIGGARSGEVAVAREEAAVLARLKEDAEGRKETYWARVIEAQRLAVVAWIARAEGKTDEALSLARAAADLEDSFEKHPVTPGPILPARELEGDLLMDLGRATDALRAFEATLKREPDRARALFGAGRAAELAGQPATARERYGALVKLMEPGDGERPELKMARAYLEKVGGA